MAGLLFRFADLVKETDSLKNIAEPFLLPGAKVTLDHFNRDLCSISRARKDVERRLTLQPLWTNPSKKYEANGREGGQEVYAVISGVWDLKPLGRKSQSREVEFCGIASTKIELYSPEHPGTRLAMWRLELGAEEAPGCYVHAQILGDTNDLPFPKWVPIPRLPSFFVTPMSAVEFALGELFQDEWAKETAANDHWPQYWRARQRKMLLSLFTWYRNCLEAKHNNSPWLALKKAKPNGELFLEE